MTCYATVAFKTPKWRELVADGWVTAHVDFRSHIATMLKVVGGRS